jgi:ABC-type maltose transport system permease subunit
MKIETKKIKNFLKKLPKILVEKFILTLIFLLVFDLLLGFLIFKVSTSFKEEMLPKIEVFNENLYQKVLEKFKEEEKKFEEIDQKIYLNPFEEK